jgi:hypothetical protein
VTGDEIEAGASTGAEALMLIEPPVVRDLIEARQREDWTKVAALIDWLAAGRSACDAAVPPGLQRRFHCAVTTRL